MDTGLDQPTCYNITSLRYTIPTLNPRVLPMPLSKYIAPTAAAMMIAPAMADVPNVIADTPIAHSFAAMVMGDLGTPSVLLDRGGDPHHMQLRPSQARAVASADLVIWSGAGLAPWMNRVVDSLAEGATLDLSSVTGLQTQPIHNAMLFDATVPGDHDDHDDHASHDDHGSHDDHDDHASHDDHSAAGHDHAHGPVDPHLWMTTQNAAPWLGAITAHLSELDPENAQTYAANAAAAAVRIDTLTAELAATLEPVGNAGLVMYHAAYGYFGAAFGLNLLGTIAMSDAADPGAARIAQMRGALSDAGAICIFPEANHNPGYVSLVAEGTDLRIGAALDPAGVMLDPGAELYAETMRGLAQAIAACVTQP